MCFSKSTRVDESNYWRQPRVSTYRPAWEKHNRRFAVLSFFFDGASKTFE